MTAASLAGFRRTIGVEWPQAGEANARARLLARARGVTIGQIAVACARGYLELRFAGDGWRRGRPRLARWYEKFAKRKSMAETQPKA